MEEPYTKRMTAAQDNLKPHLSNEFLATLVLAARTCGHYVDYTELYDFVEWSFSVADKKLPTPQELEAFDYDRD
jgi:hypothetical protein